jgi:hypothetical protein
MTFWTMNIVSSPAKSAQRWSVNMFTCTSSGLWGSTAGVLFFCLLLIFFYIIHEREKRIICPVSSLITECIASAVKLHPFVLRNACTAHEMHWGSLSGLH